MAQLPNRTDYFEVAVLFLVATLPFGGYVDIGIGGNLGFPLFNTTLLGLCTLLAGHRIALHGVSMTRTQQVFAAVYVLFVCFQWLALLVNMGPISALPSAIDYYHLRSIGYLALVGVVLVYVEDERSLRLVLVAGFIGAIAAAGIALVDGAFRLGIGPRLLDSRTVLGVTIPFARTTGVSLTFGSFGMYLLGIWPTYGLLALRDRRPGLIVGILVVTGGLLVGQTRSTWLGAGAAIGVLALVWYGRVLARQDRQRRALSLAVGGICLLAVLALVVPPLVEALVAVNSKTLQSRLTQYRSALRIVAEAPLFGVGRGAVGDYVPTAGVINQSESVHGAGLFVAASSGLPAALCYLAGPLYVFVAAARRAVTGRRPLVAAGLAASVAAVLVDAQFLTAVGKVSWVWVAVAASHEHAGSDRP